MIDEGRSCETEAQCITAIDWSPKTDHLEFAYTDNEGHFGLIENISHTDEDVSNLDEDLPEEDDVNFGDGMYILMETT